MYFQPASEEVFPADDQTLTMKKGSVLALPLVILEREKRLELSTYTLARYRSTN
jgi:hypothetical protein